MLDELLAQGAKRAAPRDLILSKEPISEFLEGASGTTHSKAAHIVLVLAGFGYWVGMSLFPVLFGSAIDSKGVPLSAMMYFVLLTNCCIFAELWVVIHTESGVRFLQYVGERLAQRDKKAFFAILAIAFSILGRLDTFSDIVFTSMLFRQQSITWFSLWGHVVYLPCELKYISLIAVVVGVFLCQALPGMILLMLKRGLTMAFKFNEFQFLLAMSELDMPEMPAFDSGAGKSPVEKV